MEAHITARRGRVTPAHTQNRKLVSRASVVRKSLEVRLDMILCNLKAPALCWALNLQKETESWGIPVHIGW